MNKTQRTEIIESVRARAVAVMRDRGHYLIAGGAVKLACEALQRIPVSVTRQRAARCAGYYSPRSAASQYGEVILHGGLLQTQHGLTHTTAHELAHVAHIVSCLVDSDPRLALRQALADAHGRVWAGISEAFGSGKDPEVDPADLELDVYVPEYYASAICETTQRKVVGRRPRKGVGGVMTCPICRRHKLEMA